MQRRSLIYMLFSFQGRMSRAEYWLRFTIPLLLLYVGLWVLLLLLALVFGIVEWGTQLLTAATTETEPPMVGGTQIVGFLVMMLTMFVASLAFLWATIAGWVKRLHDCGKGGWFFLLIFVPAIGPLLLFIWNGFIRGTVGDNRFGPDPNAVSEGS